MTGRVEGRSKAWPGVAVSPGSAPTKTPADAEADDTETIADAGEEADRAKQFSQIKDTPLQIGS